MMSENDLNNKDHLDRSGALTLSISAPGKVILYGEHSVVYGKMAIAASLGLRTRLLLEGLKSPNVIKIELAALNLVLSYDLSKMQTNLLNKARHDRNWQNPESVDHDKLLEAVKDYVDDTTGSISLQSNQRLSLYALFYLLTGILGSSNVKILPCALAISTELTVGAGTGSSASFSVVLAATFIQYLRINGGASALEGDSNNFSQFNCKHLELISKWAFLAEKIIHGSPSGVDNAICTFGSLVKFQKTAGVKIIKLGCTLRLLIINTGVQRDTSVLVTNVATWKRRHGPIVDTILDVMDNVSRDALKYLEEFNVVEDMQEEEAIHLKLRELMEINQCLLQSLQVSHPKLERICCILKEKKLRGKLTGAGGGGFAIALIPSNFSTENIQELSQELQANGFETILTNLGGSGVNIETCSFSNSSEYVPRSNVSAVDI